MLFSSLRWKNIKLGFLLGLFHFMGKFDFFLAVDRNWGARLVFPADIIRSNEILRHTNILFALFYEVLSNIPCNKFAVLLQMLLFSWFPIPVTFRAAIDNLTSPIVLIPECARTAAPGTFKIINTTAHKSPLVINCLWTILQNQRLQCVPCGQSLGKQGERCMDYQSN
jgi:hypothetical protein